MELQELRSRIELYANAHGQSLYSIDSAITQTHTLEKKRIAELKEEFERQKAIINNRQGNTLETELIRLRNNINNHKKAKKDILTTAEYIQVGSITNARLEALLSDVKNIPYIVPLFGHGHITLIGAEIETNSIVANIVWNSINHTAPGQMDIIVYNPGLKDNLSIFTGIEQFRIITTNDELITIFQIISRDIIYVDSLLKNNCKSLVELRNNALQPIGRLQLVVFLNMDFLLEEKMLVEFKRIAGNCARAGISLLCCFRTTKTFEIIMDLPNFTVLKQNNSQKWNDTLTQHEVILTIDLPIDIKEQIDEYKNKAENTSVIVIPFIDIEPIPQEWSASSADNLSFALGKNSLETVMLKLGDSVSQIHNILISGAIGQGKSNLLEVIIHSLCTRYSPHELELYIMDFKDGMTFKPYGNFHDLSYLPHAKVLGLESERDFGLATLRHLEKVRKQRAELIRNANCKDIGHFRKNNPKVELPRIVIIIDEYQKLFEYQDDIGESAATLLENLARQGRGCGIHIILASQTISGAKALIGHENNIYSQFPIRIALKNSLTESYSIFIHGNDGAAKLKVRGEAIINVNYGDIGSNVKFTVALADSKVLKNLRNNWCKRVQDSSYRPIITSKDDVARISDIINSLKLWRKRVLSGQSSPIIPCGIQVSVNREIQAIRMSNDAGRHIALLGSGDDAQNPRPMENIAVGLLQTMSVALALQHPSGNAAFSLVNAMDNAVSEKNGMTTWMATMERFGFHVDIVEKEMVAEFFVRIASNLHERNESEDSHYIICASMDRCSALGQTVENDSANRTNENSMLSFLPAGETGISAFQKVLQLGSQKGIHIVSWWTNVAMYKNHIGFNGDGYINTKIILRLDNASTQSVLGVFAKWSVQNNRALVHDELDMEADTAVIPFMPLKQRDAGLLVAEEWSYE